jgi:hypothetical protein
MFTNIRPGAAVRLIVFVIRRERVVTLFQRNIFINIGVDYLFDDTTSAVSQFLKRVRLCHCVDTAAVWIDTEFECVGGAC